MSPHLMIISEKPGGESDAFNIAMGWRILLPLLQFPLPMGMFHQRTPHFQKEFMSFSLNQRAWDLCLSLKQPESFGIGHRRLSNGTLIIDFGVKTTGGIEAGKLLARICMSDLAEISVHPPRDTVGPWPIIQVTTDQPVRACMASQYAGWPIQKDKFNAMGSGPMRSLRGKEPILTTIQYLETSDCAVGVMECDELPDESLCAMISAECRVDQDHLILCVAPTRSIAGSLQVVARSIETSLHKLSELGVDLNVVVSGYGTAPLPPPARGFVDGIGRTNDAILYGGQVVLWVDTDDRLIQETGPKIPSSASRDFGSPFAKIFKNYDHDFYKVDPGLFSPAMLTFVNLRTGNSFRFGGLRPDILIQSFGEHQIPISSSSREA